MTVYCSKCFQAFSEDKKTCPQCGGEPISPESNESNDALLGTSVREYKILAKVGEGGLGAVYKAKHTLLNEFRAIKVLREPLKRTPAFMGRFFQEAKILSSLQHPNIARLYEFFVHTDHNLYMIMEWAGHKSLRHHLHERLLLGDPLSEEEILRISQQTCLGLTVAHKKGIIHRDISTDNIMIVQAEDEELIKLIDFGIAKQYLEGHEVVGLTQTGQFLGKYKYCSPEQADPSEGLTLDSRSDLYSLGVVMYEMVTGELPFEASTPFGYIKKRLMEKPKGFENPPNASPLLQDVIMHLLEKDREMRPSSAIEVVRAIDGILANPGSLSSPQRRQTEARPSTTTDISQTGRASRKDRQATDSHRQLEEEDKTIPSEVGIPRCKPLFLMRNRTYAPLVVILFLCLLSVGGYLFFEHNNKPPLGQAASLGSGQEGLAAGERADPLPDSPGLETLPAGQEGEILVARRANASSGGEAAGRPGTQARAGLSQPNPVFASLRVSTEPSEVQVYLDGNLVGKTPYLKADLPSDSPLPLLLRKEGYQDWENTIEARPAQDLSLAVSLQPLAPPPKPATGTLRITSEPSGARVLMNGKSAGRTPARLEDLSPSDSLLIGLSKKGYKSWEKRIQPKEGEELALHASLRPVDTSFLIRSDPPGAAVTLQGRQLRGLTPVRARDLEPGRSYDLVVRLRGYQSWKGTLPPGKPGKNAFKVRLTPTPEYGSLKINSKPWTKVTLDGEYVGETPLKLDKISAGAHRLELSNEAFHIRTDPIPIEIQADQTSIRVLEFKGFVKVLSDIPLTVFLEGEKLGTTQEASWELFAGPHSLRLLNLDIRKERTSKIMIEHNQTLELLNPLGPAPD